MSDHIPSPSTAYRAFLSNLIRTREERGFSQEHLAQLTSLTPQEVVAFEAGEKPLGLHAAREWLIALGLPFTHWRDGVRVDDTDEPADAHPAADSIPTITMKSDIPSNQNNPDTPAPDSSTPLPEPTVEPEVPPIQVLYFVPGLPPVVRKIPTTLNAMQELVNGYISPFHTGVSGTIGVANDEGIVHDMPFNRYVPATGARIFGPFFVAGDAPDFRSLTPLEMETSLDALAPKLSQAEFREVMLTHDAGCALRVVSNSVASCGPSGCGGHLLAFAFILPPMGTVQG